MSGYVANALEGVLFNVNFFLVSIDHKMSFPLFPLIINDMTLDLSDSMSLLCVFKIRFFCKINKSLLL